MNISSALAITSYQPTVRRQPASRPIHPAINFALLIKFSLVLGIGYLVTLVRTQPLRENSELLPSLRPTIAPTLAFVESPSYHSSTSKRKEISNEVPT